MARQKRKYAIYRIDQQLYDLVRLEERRDIVGTTWAVSPAQAVNQYKYRNGIKPRNLYCDGGDLYSRRTFFEAVEI